MEIRLLRREDDRSGFRSGSPAPDRFFQRHAAQNQFALLIGTTYVAVESERILGFATIASAQMEVRDLPSSLQKGFPRYPLPVLRLARLAVDASFQRRGIGSALLAHVCQLAVQMATTLGGCIGLLVDAKPESVGFYRAYGFLELDLLNGALEDDRPRPVGMILPIAEIPRD